MRLRIRFPFVLNPHYESETIGEQSANYMLRSASHFFALKTEGNGVGGRLRFKEGRAR